MKYITFAVCLYLGFLRVVVSKLISQPCKSSKEQSHFGIKSTTVATAVYKFE